jgi:hypothetical protein
VVDESEETAVVAGRPLLRYVTESALIGGGEMRSRGEGKRRRMQLICLNEEEVEEALAQGQVLRRERYKESSREEMRRVYERYESFRNVVRTYRPESAEIDVLAAWSAHNLFARGVKGQTVQPEVCLIIDELRLQGTLLPKAVTADLVKGVGRRRVPPVRANPMRFEQVVLFTGRREVELHVRALAAMIWLTIKRPEHLKFPVGNVMFKSENEFVIWLPDDKNMESNEDWRCKTIVCGPFRQVLTDSWWARRAHGKDALWFTDQTVGRLMDALGRLDVLEAHPLLRTKYTLFSLRRGAIQHCRSKGLIPEEIAVMSDHHSLSALALYIGAFLSVECERSADVSRALADYVAVPSEFPSGILPQHRQPAAPLRVRLRRAATPPPSQPVSPLRLRSGTRFGVQQS